jgi:hypothetical protein
LERGSWAPFAGATLVKTPTVKMTNAAKMISRATAILKRDDSAAR